MIYNLVLILFRSESAAFLLIQCKTGLYLQLAKKLEDV
jgi:hypothetical protein